MLIMARSGDNDVEVRMKKLVIGLLTVFLGMSQGFAADRTVFMSITPANNALGDTVTFHCGAEGEWHHSLTKAKITIKNASNNIVVKRANMDIDGLAAGFEFQIPFDELSGEWQFKCILKDSEHRTRKTETFTVAAAPTEPPEEPGDGYIDSPIAAHNTITKYNGPATCIGCHQEEAYEVLDSLHMKWSGPTPQLTNSSGEELGKAVGGINTFCTYAMSSKSACFSCHVRADGNAPHPPEIGDVDCLMCHSDTYQRKFIADPNNTETVTNILGEQRTYIFGKIDDQGNYLTVPDLDKMPAGTNMINVARSVTLPTSTACLRCHGKAGGGDWTKRGDLGLSSAHATLEEDVHLAQEGANLSCVNCHATSNHKISGRGIDLRQTEAPAPTCNACHGNTPHANVTLNRHAQGQLSCQVCHIREYAKGGATEISRDWLSPVWNPNFCSGQGGFVGHEVKESFVTPEYVWFDGTSYVYNIGETIAADGRGIYPMAKANGRAFDGKSEIYPIKRHFTVMPLHENGQIIPPAIMWMFMTGDFEVAVQKGMEEQGLIGTYTLVDADAEMLITHGVSPKENAPACVECHDNTGATQDGTGMLPFTKLGYHQMPGAVSSCNLCHEKKSMSWQSMHQKHREDDISCNSCHTSEPTGFIQPKPQLCSSCHDYKSWKSEGHKKHLEKNLDCVNCHNFS